MDKLEISQGIGCRMSVSRRGVGDDRGEHTIVVENVSDSDQLLICHFIVGQIMDFFSHLALEMMDCNRIKGPEVDNIYAAGNPVPSGTAEKPS
jgi:hypothetical protein